MPRARPEGDRYAQAIAPADAGPPASPAARLATGEDLPVFSPVHRLQAELIAKSDPVDDAELELYPGWFRLAFPIGTSGLMWAGIIWAVLRFG